MFKALLYFNVYDFNFNNLVNFVNCLRKIRIK